MKNNRKLLTWVLLIIVSVVACIIIPKFTVFPSGMFIPLVIGLVALAAIMLVATLKSKGYTVSIINIVLSVALAASCALMPNLESRQNNAFSEPASTSIRYVNYYVMSSEYRSNHSSTFDTSEVSEDLAMYQYSKFIIQSELNQDDQSTALDDLRSQLGTTNIQFVEVDTVLDAIKALYNNEGDVLVLNQAFESTIKSISAFSSFDTDTQVIYTTTISDEAEETEEIEVTDTNYQEPFVIYIAAHDESTTSFSLYGRTDVDMIVAVNPNNKQILMVSIPRDFYVENPALDYGLDKLTHLGNNGIYNTLDGINNAFGLNITEYMLTDFDHFIDLVDSIGGITLDNPYEFSSSLKDGFNYPAGTITLNGEQALYYARERKSLSNGDYGRNEHQGIAMQGILTKVQELCSNGNYLSVITSLSSNFLTNISLDNMLSMYTSSTTVEGEWEYIKYHLGGEGTYAGTASMGWDRQLYVCKPFDSQLTFTREQVEKVLNNEIIIQEALPDNDQTTFEEN